MKTLIVAATLMLLSSCSSSPDRVQGTKMVRVLETGGQASTGVTSNAGAGLDVAGCRVETAGTVSGSVTMVYGGARCNVVYVAGPNHDSRSEK